MRIGELAQRLRVSTRTLRHYESVGLLTPASVDESTGYRSYGAAELLRGVRIEQLKGTGLSLEEIRAALDGDAPFADVLDVRKRQIEAKRRELARQLRVVDALHAADAVISEPVLVTVPARDVVAVRVEVSPDAIGSSIRRHIQRLRRAGKREGSCVAQSFAARFPIDLDATHVVVEIAALTDGRSPTHGAGDTVSWSQERVMQSALAGPHSLLPLAYDAVLTAVAEQRLQPTGSVCETYVDLGRSPTTVIAVPLAHGED